MTKIEIVDAQLRIDGVPRVLLMASLFPFRVPRAQWRERIAAVAALGYDALDVYVPWNFHETEPGEWDFTGERDIDHFLQLVEEAGLLVLARPGPYICSEWDGGGLPAWLTIDADLRLRQNEPRYLRAVRTWFDHVLPILARHQVTEGGCVALVQLENELDFFDCEDPDGYVGALVAMARDLGIEVPLVACAGQGDIEGAGGLVDDMVPAANIYPSDESTDIEEHVAYFERAMRERGYPLLTTETNRLHRTLKRMLVGGVRLLGPYLQASGWNREYGTAVNNWGSMLGFMTHDYDFGGTLRPDGAERPDAAEARLLAGVIRALGPRLAAGIPTGPATGTTGGLSHALRLAGGGELLALTDLGDGHHAVVSEGSISVDVRVPASTCLLLVRGLPLATVGARLVLANAELTSLAEEPGAAHLAFSARGRTTIRLETGRVLSVDLDGDLVLHGSDGVALDGSAGIARIRTDAGILTITVQPVETPPSEAPAPVVALDTVSAGPAEQVWRSSVSAGAPVPLERAGVFRGTGRYTAAADLRDAIGVVLGSAADILSIRTSGSVSPWRANPGTDLWWPLPDGGAADDRIEVTARIWGHSNFDDTRLPSLELGSFRGIDELLVVRERAALDEGWIVSSGAEVRIGTAPAPRGGFGGWMSSTFPQTVTYHREVGAALEGAAALRIVDGACKVEVRVDDEFVGDMTPSAPVLLLPVLEPGQGLSLTTTRVHGEPAGSVELLRGDLVSVCSIAAAATPELIESRSRSQASMAMTRLPRTVAPGDSLWIRVDGDELDESRDSILRIDADRLLVTAMVGDEMLGRMWSEEPDGAALKGGRGDLIVVPAPWSRRGVDLLLEATGPGAVLRSIAVGGPIDREEEGE